MDPQELIQTYERVFAARLASRVLTKPQLNAWMIFIPFIFIFYFQDFSKYKKQRKAFIDNWLLSRKRMLNESVDALDEDRAPDLDGLCAVADLPEKAKSSYRHLLQVLADHYTRLLRGDAQDYPGLVRTAYHGKKGEYLFFVNQLIEREKTLNKALAPQLKKSTPHVGRTISKIETQADQIRRQEIEDFF